MASQSWMNLLNAGVPWQTTAGTVLNTAASATISPQVATTQDFVLPGQPNGLQWYPGMVLRIIARGTLASGGTTSTLTVFLACGASGTLGTGSITAQPWKLEAHVGCTAIGTSGNTLSTEGELIFGDTATPAFGTANVVISALPLTALAFNTYTAGTALGLRATLSAAFGSILCNQFLIEQLCL
jgi:hypothetical protein